MKCSVRALLGCLALSFLVGCATSEIPVPPPILGADLPALDASGYLQDLEKQKFAKDIAGAVAIRGVVLGASGDPARGYLQDLEKQKFTRTTDGAVAIRVVFPDGDTRYYVRDDHLVPDADNTYDLGKWDRRIRDAYFGPGSVYIGNTNLAAMTYDTNTTQIVTSVRFVYQESPTSSPTIYVTFEDVFTGAGSTGLVYSTAGDAGKFYRADGTWQVAGADTTYTNWLGAAGLLNLINASRSGSNIISLTISDLVIAGVLTNYTESDPIWVANSNLFYYKTQADGLFATGTPLYAESDPIWVANSNLFYYKTVADALFATGTPLYVESDPIWVADSNAYARLTDLNTSSNYFEGVIFKADGSVVMTGPANWGGQWLTNVFGIKPRDNQDLIFQLENNDGTFWFYDADGNQIAAFDGLSGGELGFNNGPLRWDANGDADCMYAVYSNLWVAYAVSYSNATPYGQMTNFVNTISNILDGLMLKKDGSAVGTGNFDFGDYGLEGVEYIILNGNRIDAVSSPTGTVVAGYAILVDGNTNLYFGAVVHTESDPIWVANSNLFYYKTQADGLFATGTPLYAESDPIWVANSNLYAYLSKTNNFTVRPQVNGANVAIVSDIPTNQHSIAFRISQSSVNDPDDVFSGYWDTWEFLNNAEKTTWMVTPLPHTTDLAKPLTIHLTLKENTEEASTNFVFLYEFRYVANGGASTQAIDETISVTTTASGVHHTTHHIDLDLNESLISAGDQISIVATRKVDYDADQWDGDVGMLKTGSLSYSVPK